jgi:putative PIN family toxin of toxin-antitoxin system
VVGVTADTNIYISALIFAGLPRQFLLAAEDARIHLFISEPIRQELLRILQTQFSWSNDQVNETLLQLESCTEMVRPTETLDVIKEDPDDNRVLECAVAAGARFIVSGDNDLLRLGQFRNIRIVKVADFLKLITPP